MQHHPLGTSTHVVMIRGLVSVKCKKEGRKAYERNGTSDNDAGDGKKQRTCKDMSKHVASSLVGEPLPSRRIWDRHSRHQTFRTRPARQETYFPSRPLRIHPSPSRDSHHSAVHLHRINPSHPRHCSTLYHLLLSKGLECPAIQGAQLVLQRRQIRLRVLTGRGGIRLRWQGHQYRFEESVREREGEGS